MKRALTIAGFDPSGYAGIVADLMTFRAIGVEGVSAITALTVQDRKAVKSSMAVDPKLLTAEVEIVTTDMPVCAVKVGMLGSSANARALDRILKRKKFKNVVLDPVFRSSSGFPLIDEAGIPVVKRLLKLVTVVTPNLDEAGILTGTSVNDLNSMEAAARAIHSVGPGAVVIKGGHMSGRPVDVLFDGRHFYHFEGRRIRGGAKKLHGTGCVFSSAIAAGLARGFSVKKAVEVAKEHLERVLRVRR